MEGLYRVTDLRLEAAKAALVGTVEARATGQVQADLEVPEVSPRSVLEALAIELPPAADPQTLSRFSASTRVRVDGSRIAVDPLRAQLDESTLTGQVQVSDFAGPTASFTLQLDQMNVDRYLPPPSEEPEPEAPAEEGEAGSPMEPLRTLVLDGTVEVGQLTISGARASDIRLMVTARNGQVRVHPITARLYGGTYSGDLKREFGGPPGRAGDLAERDPHGR